MPNAKGEVLGPQMTAFLTQLGASNPGFIEPFPIWPLNESPRTPSNHTQTVEHTTRLSSCVYLTSRDAREPKHVRLLVCVCVLSLLSSTRWTATLGWSTARPQASRLRGHIEATPGDTR